MTPPAPEPTPHTRRTRHGAPTALAGLLILLAIATAAPARAADAGPYVIDADTLEWTRDGNTVHAVGNVLVSHPGGLLQATEATLHVDRHIFETGAPFAWEDQDSRGTARAATVNTEARTGEFFDADIHTGDGTHLWGRRIVRLAPDRFEIDDGGFTPCECPAQGAQPAWKITVKSADVRWRESVRFRQGTFWGRRAPFLWLPAGYVPMLDSRQTGLLIPRLSVSERYGFVIKPGFFLAMGDQADLTVWSDYTTRGGWGAEAEARAVSRRGDYALSYDWFKEADDADFLVDEGRGAARRWDLRLRANERPGDWFRLQADMKVVSDARSQTDFATDLEDLTRTSAYSRLEASQEWSGIGAANVRLGANQALLDAAATGSRAPSVWLRADPQRFGKLPVWTDADLRYDRFSTFNAARGSPWHPNAYDLQARRLTAGIRTGAEVDPVPGLLLRGRLGGYTLWRDRTFYTVLSDVPYATRSSVQQVTASVVGVAEATAEYGVQLRAGRARAVVRPGVDSTWSRPTDAGAFPIEDLDSAGWQTWLVPRVFSHGDLAGHVLWRYDARYPVAYAKTARPLHVWSHDVQASAADVSVDLRVWHDTRRRDVPRVDSLLSWEFLPDQKLAAGFARSASDFTLTAWDLGRGGGPADDLLPVIPYRELLLRYDWQAWRLFGYVVARRRFPQVSGETAAWVQRGIELGYHDPCECLRLAASYNDLPGTSADRFDLRIDFALLGGVGTGDWQ